MWGDVGRVAVGGGVAQASAPTAKRVGLGLGRREEDRASERREDVIDVGARRSGRVN